RRFRGLVRGGDGRDQAQMGSDHGPRNAQAAMSPSTGAMDDKHSSEHRLSRLLLGHGLSERLARRGADRWVSEHETVTRAVAVRSRHYGRLTAEHALGSELGGRPVARDARPLRG